MDYLREPAAIYARSFEIIRAEADVSRFTAVEQAIAVRMIHACGMTDLVEDLVISPGFVEAASGALSSALPVFVDVEMVRHGIIARKLAAGNEIICTLNSLRAHELGVSLGITRSAAAVDLWLEKIGGSLVVIGNAPTALFRLLEHLDAGCAKPAAIIACPVGFVGAAESKAEIAANNRGVPFLTVRGRRGGSAMASAVVNALAGGAP
jgi:precorrin-8X/cobalt-precorrin-8 methylmutase